MLEATIVLELGLGKNLEAAIVAILLGLNAVISFIQERRAQAALDLLREKLTVIARVLRDGSWQSIPSRLLVPGDYVHVRVGDVTPADVLIAEGVVQVDQSTLTGESLPVDRGASATIYAGSVVVRGEASGVVIATGSRTYYGRTAELVKTARTVSHLESVIVRIVRSLVLLDFLLALAVAGSTFLHGGSPAGVLSFVVVILLASVPVALPATFALAGALGAVDLSRSGVLTARLSAIEEAASMDVLCADKTGTITTNHLAVGEVRAYPPWSPAELVTLAAAASDAATQDPLDLAVLARAREDAAPDAGERLQFIPFDPATKRSEAVVKSGGGELSVAKGAPSVIQQLCTTNIPTSLGGDIESIAEHGMRVLAVAAGHGDQLGLVGLIGLEDPPRPDSAELVKALSDRGIRVLMVTGDGIETARAIAEQIGIRGPACTAQEFGESKAAEGFSVVAGVLPEDKFSLVKGLQAAGSIVGMTGDGVNDAPALRQSEVGIAVAGATDVAKAAASLVLTGEGLKGIVTAVETARRIYQRMLTYTLNASIKKLEVPLFLSILMLATGHLLLTPLLMVLLFVTNDFATMAITTDKVGFSRRPDRWRVRQLLLGAFGIALPLLIGMLAVYWIGGHLLHLDLERLRTLTFLGFVFTSQATIYMVREPRHFWSSRPSSALLAASAGALSLAIVLGSAGWLMAPLGAVVPIVLLIGAVGYAALVDLLKVRIFRVLRLHEL